jgi:hypothetical protein
MKNFSGRRIFWASFFSASLVLLLLWGLATVDYECRRIGFGDGNTLIYRMTGKNPAITCIDGGI